ncbi:DltD domain-containing protein [Alkalihalobacillus pseudalcaliphilus]|nr:DltD domain-containing protein [Alkalihalobacillus pseudalcaliphilus]
MDRTKVILLDQLLANANDRSWYLSFQEAVEGLSQEEAFWKPDEDSHNIAEIVQHLIYWNEVWQIRYEQAHFLAVEPIENNANSFLVPTGSDFPTLKNKLLTTLLKWQDLLSETDKLESSVTGFPVAAEWWALISNATTHNAYHIGQIVYIRKMKR